MPSNPEILSSPPSTEERKKDLAIKADKASKELAAYMAESNPDQRALSDTEFVYRLGFLVRNQKALPTEERRRGVKNLVHTLQTNPKDRKTVTQHFKPLLTSGELGEFLAGVQRNKFNKEIIACYQAGADALGLGKEFKQALADSRKTDLKRRLLFLGGGVAGLTALVGVLYKTPNTDAESKTLVVQPQSKDVSPNPPRPTLQPTPTATPPTPTTSPTSTLSPTLEPTRVPEATRIPTKEERIFYPPELSYTEVRDWIGKLRNTHDAVLTESLFTTELAGMNPSLRERVLDAIALAHAQALVQHYGDNEAIIGLDPGHGGSDVGSVAGGLAEKNLTWKVAQLTADKLFELSKGKYKSIILRPENPQDEDLDGDRVISNVERIQKRKALLMKMEAELRKDTPSQIGKNIVYVSIHFNGGRPGDRGTEVYSPNETGMENPQYRASSDSLGTLLQKNIVSGITNAGYTTTDRGDKIDPDSRIPGPNTDTNLGPYLVLGSNKLDRVLQGV